MAGFGQSPFARRGAPLGWNLPVSLRPSPSWDGTAQSGFTSPPSDPVRTTAKPAVQLLTLPNQYFASRLELDVLAIANDGGSMIGGIDRVRFHFEGNSIDVVEPALRSFSRFDGSIYLLPCYSVSLRKPSDVSGDAHVFIEAIPADANMQPRVIGPIEVFPHDRFATGTIHDVELTVDPQAAEVAGANYHSFTAAHTFINANSAENPRITFKGAAPNGFYDIEEGHFANYQRKGWLTVEADVPIIFGKQGPFVDALQADGRPKLDAVWMKGSEITLEMSNMTITSEFSTHRRGWAFDKVRIQNFDGIEKVWMKGPRIAGVCSGQNFFLDCYISDLPSLFNGSQLARGNISEGTWFDLASNSQAVIANAGHDHSSAEWLVEQDALTVQYSGPAATATVEMDGANDAATRNITVKVDGVPNEVLTVSRIGSSFDPSATETVQDVVDWFNSLPDWTATLISDDRRATLLGARNAGGNLAAEFSAQDAKSAAFTFIAAADLHSDFYQTQNTGGEPFENTIIYGNTITKFAGQKLFISAQGNDVNDLFAVNNAIGDDLDATGNEAPGVLFSQLGRSPHSHVVIAHNSMTQSMALRTSGAGGVWSADGFCLLSNNVLRDASYDGGVDNVDLVVSNNHLFAGSVDATNATGTSIGGDELSLYADFAAGDFAPAGELVASPKPAILTYNGAGVERSTSEAAGAGAMVQIDFASLPPPIEPPAAAPAFVSSDISGAAMDGEVLTANWNASGYPVPSAAYQWQRNGVDLTGETAESLTLDASTMSLAGGDLISCEITLSNPSGIANAAPSVAYDNGSLGPSLYDTSDMTQEFNTSYSELLGPDSFRVARDASQLGRLAIASVPNGSYRIRGTVSAYDGAITGINSVRFRIVDNFSGVFDTFSVGAIDETVAISSGTLRFDTASAGFGFRLDALHIEAV